MISEQLTCTKSFLQKCRSHNDGAHTNLKLNTELKNHSKSKDHDKSHTRQHFKREKAQLGCVFVGLFNNISHEWSTKIVKMNKQKSGIG